MKKLLCIICAVVSLVVSAAVERHFIWPEGKMPYSDQKHLIAAMTDVKNFKADEWRHPYLEWSKPPAADKKNGACVILISGGAYNCCCDVGHVRNWEKMLTEEGVTCVNFVYRTPRPHGLPIWQCAWADAQRAVRIVRSEAAKRGFDPNRIGTMSMSAGSHLATLLATSSMTPAYEPVDDLDKAPCNINFACTFAIAYALTDGVGCPNMREGDSIDTKLDSVFKFDKQTCPMWMSHGGKDVYSPMASTLVYRKLRQMKIPAEVHIYPDKGHAVLGFDRAVEFLRQMQYFGPLAKSQGLADRYHSDKDRATYEKVEIWPKGKMPYLQTEVKQCEPFLEWHTPKKLTTKGIQIIWSGGSYMGNSTSSFEVAPFRRYLNEKGMTVVTVQYRTPRPAAPLAKHTTAWADIQRAIRIVRSEAEKRGLDPNRIGIMGSSAGGHLALMGATSSCRKAYGGIDKIDNLPCNPQWAVAIYPAYALTDGLDHPNTKGGNEDSARLAPEFSFDLKTPPILFIHGDNDAWAAMNSVKTWEQLSRMGIQGELHTLALRPHCFQGWAVPGTGSHTWMDRIWEFMQSKGFNK